MKLSAPPPPVSLPPNPGGVLPPADVIGRDEEINGFWAVLALRSLLLLAPRRLGKTSVCARMVAWAPEGFEAHYRDLEGKGCAMDLVRMLFEDVSRLLEAETLVAEKARAVVKAFTGSIESSYLRIELPEADWKRLLGAIFADLQRYACQQGVVVVLFWDEFPLFIRDMHRAGRSREAMTLLDHLRTLRHSHDHVRMVLTGSIGMHEVLTELEHAGYANEPVNDMAKEVLEVLRPDQAKTLATALLRGVGQDDPRLATWIAARCECHPFLIQHLVQRLRDVGMFSPEAADAQFEQLIEEGTDPLELQHYLSRLTQHFEAHELAIARAVLDLAATREEGYRLDELLGELRIHDADDVRAMVGNLLADLYLVRERGIYRFRYAFLRRYWKQERGL